MTAVEVVARARALGVVLEPAGDKLRYRPASACPPDLKAALAEHKAAILAHLGAAPPSDPAAGLSAASLASFAALGQIVTLNSRTLGGSVYLVPDASAAARLVEAGIPRARCYTPGELCDLAILFAIAPPQRAGALRALDALREIFGDLEVVGVRPALVRGGMAA